jgi:DDE superfamily endonuclease
MVRKHAGAHTLKTQLVVEKSTRRILCIAHGNGRRHDLEPLSTVDIRACRECTPKRTCPKSAAKRIRLSASDKAKNRDISSERVPCENVTAMLKRFKIIADRYRNRRPRFGLRFFLIAAIYNKELQLP